MNGSQEIEKAQILHNSMEFCKICVLSTVKNPAETKASAGYNIRHNNRRYGIIVSYRCGAVSRTVSWLSGPIASVWEVELYAVYFSIPDAVILSFLCVATYSASPYFVLIRSSFSSIGSAPSQRNTNVAMARTRSTGRPVT